MTQTKHRAAAKNWDPQSLPSWFDKKYYKTEVMPLLANLKRSIMVSTIKVSAGYANDIAGGKVVPHPRHWAKLAGMAGISGGSVLFSEHNPV